MSTCASCGADQPVGAKFCNECGADLRDETQTLPGPAATPVASRRITARGGDPREVVEATPEVDDTVFFLDLARAVALAFAGDPRAVTTVTAAIEGAYAVAGIYEDFTLVYGAGVSIAAQFGDAELYDRLRRIVDDDGSTPPAGLAGHRALLSALDVERIGDEAGAEEAFVEALRHYEAWGSPVHLARAQAAYGVWLQRRRVADGEPLLALARERYIALGATAWHEELERQREEAGV
jgi:hypothetical protein